MAQQQMLRASLDSLTAKARSVLAVLTDPSLDPTRWKEPAVFAAFRRALTLLVKNAVVSEGNTRSTFFVQLFVTTDPIATPDSASVWFIFLPRNRKIAPFSFWMRKARFLIISE
ncbi:MAG: hypothetical protein ACJ8CR_30715 [Roseiflexaceae bacterium]